MFKNKACEYIASLYLYSCTVHACLPFLQELQDSLVDLFHPKNV